VCNTSHFSLHYSSVSFTLCCQVAYKDVIGIPCCIDGSHISKFSYTKSCTCIFQLVWLTYHFKVIDSLLQDFWVSSYKQTAPDPLFLEPSDCIKETTDSDTLSIFLPNFLQLQLWLCVGVF